MTPDAGLVERLRAYDSRNHRGKYALICREAATALAARDAEVARLTRERDALKAIANVARRNADMCDDEETAHAKTKAERDALAAEVKHLTKCNDENYNLSVSNADERDELRTEIVTLRAETVAKAREITDLIDERDAALADARRYRWLRLRMDSVEAHPLHRLQGYKLDRAIDSALAAQATVAQEQG